MTKLNKNSIRMSESESLNTLKIRTLDEKVREIIIKRNMFLKRELIFKEVLCTNKCK